MRNRLLLGGLRCLGLSLLPHRVLTIAVSTLGRLPQLKGVVGWHGHPVGWRHLLQILLFFLILLGITEVSDLRRVVRLSLKASLVSRFDDRAQG